MGRPRLVVPLKPLAQPRPQSALNRVTFPLAAALSPGNVFSGTFSHPLLEHHHLFLRKEQCPGLGKYQREGGGEEGGREGGLPALRRSDETIQVPPNHASILEFCRVRGQYSAFIMDVINGSLSH